MRVRVQNSGPGIAESDLPHIFDRFYQGRMRATAGQAGRSLGLAIVREMVTLHDGYIDVTSDLDDGTTFTVFLPGGIEPVSQAPRTVPYSIKSTIRLASRCWT